MLRRLFAILFMIGISCRAATAQQEVSSSNALEQLQKLNQVYRYLNGLYVEEVDMAPLVEKAVKSMLAELDPHSAYIDADEMRNVQVSFDGEFSGIGVEFNILKDTIMVVNTIAGGPAEQVGVLPNDRIVAIDGHPAVGMSQREVPRHLRGETGSKVEITVARHGVTEPLNFLITRNKIPLNTVDAAYMVDKRTGYIKVNRFGHTTMKEFREAYERMKPLEGLILDLRGNSGGLLEQAIEMANFFLPKGSLIVSTEGRAITRRDFEAEEEGRFTKGNVVVLLDENSASASEIVAGALQDWDRAVIIGRPSFGKGLVQRQFPLADGSAVRVTIARYHTPSGRVIQRPYEAGKREDYYKAHYERMNRTDTLADAAAADSTRYRTLRSGRTVRGGGGITPDIRIEADTAGMSDYLMKLVRRGVINEYVLSYLDRNRKSLEANYLALADYESRFEVTQQLFDELAALGEERDVPFDAEGFAVSEEIIRNQLRAAIAQKLFDLEAFYRIINTTPQAHDYQRAVEVLNDWKRQGEPLLQGPQSPTARKSRK